MLKIDSISVAKNDFDPVELDHLAGTAALKNGVTEVAAGRFRMSNAGRGTMCTIDAACVAADGITLNSPEALTVELNAVFKREFLVKANATAINTRCKELNQARLPEGEWVPISGEGAMSTDDKGNYLFPVTAVNEDRIIELELDAKVGDGTAHDANANHKLKITPDNDENLIHFAILCNVGAVDVALPHGRRPNKATFEVRGAKPWKVMGEKQPVAFKAPAESKA